MKKMSINKMLVILVTAALLFGACAKETSNVRLSPSLATSELLSIKSDSVTVVGFVISTGSGFTKRGICYSKDTLPVYTATSDSSVVYTGALSTATFSVQIYTTRLSKYHARAFGVESNGTVTYGLDIPFNTPAALPKLAAITAPTMKITQDSGVTVQTAVNITDDGYADNNNHITARGVVYGLSTNPIIDSVGGKGLLTKTFDTQEGTGKGAFSSLALNLNGNTTYYLRAYCTNAIGHGYSNVVSFTTPKSYAIITTNPITGLGHTNAVLNGTITNTGGGTISDQGFVWGTTANPTVTSGRKVSVSPVNNVIKDSLTGLTISQTYHVRAYVVNEIGTNYGADVSFTTLP